jgi:hypothetical protein
MNDWQHQQQQDEQQQQEAAIQALKAALTRPLTRDEAMTLAYSAGVANDFYRSQMQ